jgi:hypothetical protein
VEQWVGWQLFAKWYGTPRVRGDLWTAIGAHTTAQVNSTRRLDATKFIHQWGKPPVKRQSTGEMKALAEAWVLQAQAGTKPATEGDGSQYQ